MELQLRPRRPAAAAAWVSPLAMRALHRYCGAIFAPTLLFFALSGMLQVFDLHKPRGWEGREPPAWVRTLAGLHKDQKLMLEPAPEAGKVAGKAKAKAETAGPEHARAMPIGQELLKLYAAVASASLALSTVAGLLIAWRDLRRRAWLAGLVAAGVLVPLGLALLS